MRCGDVLSAVFSSLAVLWDNTTTTRSTSNAHSTASSAMHTLLHLTYLGIASILGRGHDVGCEVLGCLVVLAAAGCSLYMDVASEVVICTDDVLHASREICS